MNLKFWKKEQKASRTAVLIGGTHPGGVVWTERNYENFAKETYMKNVIAFRCIDMIAKNVASVPWKICRLLENDEVENIIDHPFNSVLKRANPENSWLALTYAHISYLCMCGNAFLEKITPETGKETEQIKELWSLRPDRMKINVDDKTGLVVGYTYCIGGREIEFPVDPITMQSDILHMKMFHPLDDFWGSPRSPPLRAPAGG